MNGAVPEVDGAPQGRKSEGRLTPVTTHQREGDDAVRRMGFRVRRARQFEDMGEDFDGDPVDGGLSVLLAREDGLHAREECG